MKDRMSGRWGIFFIRCGIAMTSLPALGAGPATAPSDSIQDIQFQRGRCDFEGGDTILITSVRGPGDSISPGSTYEVQGTYILSSHDDARLVAGVTPMGGDNIDTSGKNQSTVVDKGMGKFDLMLAVPVKGYPYLGFSTADDNVSFGQLYFGTTGTVLQVAADASGDSITAASDAAADQSGGGITLDVDTALSSVSFSRTGSILPGPASGNFAYRINFQNGFRQFQQGDNIVIQEIRGTAATFLPGNQYEITGIYSLTSQNQAMLAAFVTAAPYTHGGSADVSSGQVKMISGGTGEFTIIFPMTYAGSPHVSLYPASGGHSFGIAYFGTAGATQETLPPGLNDTLYYSQSDNTYDPDNLTVNSVVTTTPTSTPKSDGLQAPIAHSQLSGSAPVK
ncbi:MAG: hypothetical protein ABSF29_12280 [Tepidisphaeraceae bacterium]|jgi:hypothetical protein